MKLTDDEWQFIYELRNSLENEEDRRAMRRLIRRTEQLERRVERIKEMARTWRVHDGETQDV